jgi:hypothetical protein
VQVELVPNLIRLDTEPGPQQPRWKHQTLTLTLTMQMQLLVLLMTRMMIGIAPC